jgi:hypothetical protein
MNNHINHVMINNIAELNSEDKFVIGNSIQTNGQNSFTASSFPFNPNKII